MAERPIPNRGITGGGDGRFFVRYVEPADLKGRMGIIRELSQTGLTPHFIGRRQSIHHPGYDLLMYAPIRGYNLFELPTDRREIPYTNAFAKQFARALTDLHDAGFSHGDAHAQNFMLEDGTGRVVIIDDKTIKRVDPELNLAGQLAYVFLQTYLQAAPYTLISDLNRAGTIHTLPRNPWTRDEVVENMSEEDKEEIEVDALLHILHDRGIAQRIDPELLHFIRDAWIHTSRPDDLSRIFALADN